MTNDPFAIALKRHRVERGWTLAHLARRSKVSRSQLSKAEMGQRNMSREAISMVSDGLGLAPWDRAHLFRTAGFIDEDPLYRGRLLALPPEASQLIHYLQSDHVPAELKAYILSSFAGLIQLVNVWHSLPPSSPQHTDIGNTVE